MSVSESIVIECPSMIKDSEWSSAALLIALDSGESETLAFIFHGVGGGVLKSSGLDIGSSMKDEEDEETFISSGFLKELNKINQISQQDEKKINKK